MAKRKRPGGIQQRLAQVEAPLAEELEQDSLLAAWLHRQWAEGFFSPQTIQKIAMLARKDFEAAHARAPPALLKLAKLGSSGMYENNMHPELLQQLGPLSSLPHALPVKIPMKLCICS